MERITSSKNQLLKDIKKLHLKKYRHQMNSYLLEGEHLVEEALTYGVEMEWCLTTDEGLINYSHLIEQISSDKIRIVSEGIFQTLSTLPTPQPILAVVKPQEKQQIITYGKVLMLDCVQDPGNVGTLIRTADAAGFSHVILGEGTADIYQSKVLRAMQGSQYHLEIIEADLNEKIAELQTLSLPVFGTELNDAAVNYREVGSVAKYGLIMGNEGQGTNPIYLQQTDKNLYIPMVGKAESLNVAIAGGILMFSL